MSILNLALKKLDLGLKVFKDDPKVPIYSQWGFPSQEEISTLLGLSKSERITYLDQYKEHVWVYICTYDVSEAAASVPWKLFSKKDPQKEIENHEILDLINMPNLKTPAHDFRFDIYAYRLLQGNSYTYLVGNNPNISVSESNLPKAMFNLIPNRIGVKRGKVTLIEKYTHIIDAEIKTFDPVEIVHTKQFNPTDRALGQSNIEAIKNIILEDKHAAQYQASFFRNGLVPSGVLSVEDTLGEKQYKRLKKQIEEDRVGTGKSHKPWILEEGAKWQSIAMTPKDIEWLNKYKINRDTILSAFGEPPTIAGIEGANYAESKVYEQIFWTKTVLPMVNGVIGIFNIALCPFYGDDLFLQADTTGIQALHENLSDISNIGKDLVPTVITQNEMRAMLSEGFGFDLPKIDGGDTLYVQSTMIPISEMGGEAVDLGET